MNQVLDDILAKMRMDPKMSTLLKMAYPRRIVPPNGYMNPRYYAPTTVSAILHTLISPGGASDFVKGVLFFIARKLVLLKTPTFFIGQEFAEAIAETDIETGMRTDEITWPDEAMLFVLPSKFSMEYTGGFRVPFLAMANYTKDDLSEFKNLKVLDAAQDYQAVDMVEALARMPGHVFINCQWHETDEDVGVDYVTSWPSNYTLEEVGLSLAGNPLQVMEEEKIMIEMGQIDRVGLKDETKEKELINKMRDFAAKLLLAMHDVPQFIERGQITRPVKIRRGITVKQELWSPNTIGYRYSHPFSDGAGTHASPRFHRRRGHRRDQRYGPGNSLVRNIRIWPTWVGVKGNV